jgi:hypothetical protein
VSAHVGSPALHRSHDECGKCYMLDCPYAHGNRELRKREERCGGAGCASCGGSKSQPVVRALPLNNVSCTPRPGVV